MRYFIVAGEASGDLHASNLMRGIKAKDSSAEFRFFGGDLMKAQGGTLVKHYRDMAFMGFLEVLLNLRTISGNMRLCKDEILAFKPDVLILVDYPGFNLRIARFAKKNEIRVFYYIAPKVWAWNESRVKVLKKYVDTLFIIFPFEQEYFARHGINAVYLGNPTPDAIEQKIGGKVVTFNQFVEDNKLSQKPIIALLAGSRKQEIRYNLPVMLRMVEKFPDYQLVIAGAPSLSEDVYRPYVTGKNVAIVFDQTYQLLSCSTLALVTSGTATLETALLNVPQVVCYRGNILSMLVAWVVIRVKYISLVNLNMQAEVVKELKQFDLTPENLHAEASKLLPGSPEREKMLTSYAQLQKQMGGSGASMRVGDKIVELISR